MRLQTNGELNQAYSHTSITCTTGGEITRDYRVLSHSLSLLATCLYLTPLFSMTSSHLRMCAPHFRSSFSKIQLYWGRLTDLPPQCWSCIKTQINVDILVSYSSKYVVSVSNVEIKNDSESM